MSAPIDQTDWTPWSSHDGRGCPLPLGVLAQAEGLLPSGTTFVAEAVIDDEDHHRRPNAWWDEDFGKAWTDAAGRERVLGRILRYRTRVYPAASRLIEDAGRVRTTAWVDE